MCNFLYKKDSGSVFVEIFWHFGVLDLFYFSLSLDFLSFL